MGIPFSIQCDPCINNVIHWLGEKVAYIHHLEKNLAALEKTMRELKARREDLLRRVTREEHRGMQRLAEIQVWLTNAEDIEIETNELLRTRNDELQRLCLCGFCSKSLRSSYRYGKKVILTLREVEKLKTDVFQEVAEQPETSEVQERQLQPIIVGQETMLDEAWKRLKEDEVGIMGIYGMGGVGKTTLITQLNNKFSIERCGFDFVLWVVVSKELNLEKIQDDIAQKVGLGGKTKEIIYNFFKKKRFVLFLDDIWEKVDLTEIGMPFPTTQNKCKVVFTTRKLDVCAHMMVEDPMEVKCLEDDVAFDLFQKKVGKRALGSDPEIPDLARIVAKKCRGLPLALNVIGETMSCKRTIQEWRHAIDVLTEYASEFYGMEDKILPLLKYSYDNLKGEKVKSCLLYCALFPEDYKILKKGLIDYWIGQGIIDGSEGIERARDKGYEIIGSLVRASLLMEEADTSSRYGTEKVCMHDVIREMALWIASDLGKQKEAFIVRAGVGLRAMPKVKNWSGVRRMSLMENEIRHLVGKPECLQLTTLLLQETKLEYISSDFFKSMPKLTVLDLSGNRNISVLPNGIAELVSLQYLNLSRTYIRHLPIGGQGLKKLIHLDLRGTCTLSSLVGISNLQSLKVLELVGSLFSWNLKTMEELGTLEHLEVLTLEINHPPSLERYLSSDRLASCTRELTVHSIHLESSEGISLPVTMKNLRELFIMRCNFFEIKMVDNPRNPCFLSLSNVEINNCQFLRELTFLMFAPNLKHLHVKEADQLKDIINKERACESGESEFVPFRKLISLRLENLPELKSIYWRPLRFQCLEKICVFRCPNLKKLPLDSQTGNAGVILEYRPREWIRDIEWENQGFFCIHRMG